MTTRRAGAAVTVLLAVGVLAGCSGGNGEPTPTTPTPSTPTRVAPSTTAPGSGLPGTLSPPSSGPAVPIPTQSQD